MNGAIKTPQQSMPTNSVHNLRDRSTNGMCVAIVDHDLSHAERVDRSLRLAGHHCYHFACGETLIRPVRQHSFDAFLLEWNLPDISGVDVLKYIRANRQPAAPVLFVSAQDREADLVSAFRAGADAYIVKPVRGRELIARLEAIARRCVPGARRRDVLKLGIYEIDGQQRTLLRDGAVVEMAPKEFDLTLLLMRSVGQLLSRSDIHEQVWGRGVPMSSRSMDTYVSRVRSRVGFTPDKGWRLAAVYGYGYRLERLAAGVAAPRGGFSRANPI